jgi:lactate 2-monooxygenase
MLNRAKKAGYTALVVTLDTYILGWRPSDMDNGYVNLDFPCQFCAK